MLRNRLVRSASVGAALAVLGALAVPIAAQAAPGDDVLVFSNSNVVDTSSGASGGEYEWISAAITAAGYDVTPFDGGDGLAATWTAALADIEVFVLPEQEAGWFYEPGSPPAWLSEAAKDVLIDWIQAGGAMLVSGACDPEDVYLLGEAVGVDYSDVMTCDSFGTATRWIDDDALPATLPYVNGTYTMTLSRFSEAQLAPLTVWYSGEYDNECTGETLDELGAGVFTAGSGRVAIEAWDYFNDSSNPGQADWNVVLDSLLNGNTAASTWEWTALPSAPKTPVTAVTEYNESLFSVGPIATCEDGNSLLRIDPATALASPVGNPFDDGWVSQGAWNPVSETAYFPFLDYDSGDQLLMTVDPDAGAFVPVGTFTAPDLDYIEEVYSIAIGSDGAAYLFADASVDGTDYDPGLFSLDLSDASIALIAQVDDSLLDEPDGFAADPASGLFYAFDEDSHELFRVNVASGALTSLGVLDSPSLEDDDSDITSLQIGRNGVFWVVFDNVDQDDVPEEAGMLATFTLADISGGTISATEHGVLTDDPFPSRSLLMVPGGAVLAATGVDLVAPVGGAVLLVVLGSLVVLAFRRRTV